MSNVEITDEVQKNAKTCMSCPICRKAREKQRGLAYVFVKYVERGLCPKCAAYEKVYGRKAHEPIPVE